MTIIASPVHGKNSTTQLSRLFEKLDPQPQATLRRLTHVLRPPIDAPRAIDVIYIAARCISAYKESLVYPNDVITQLTSEIEQLIEAINLCTQLMNIRDAHEKPLYRRLTRYPGWALCIAINDYPENLLFSEAAGVEIALSFASEKTFPDGYGNDIRRALENIKNTTSKNLRGTYFSFSKHFEKAKREASILFENVPTPSTENNPDANLKLNFNHEVKQQLLQRRKYARPQHRAGILNRHCQSTTQIVQSALELRQNVEAGDETAILIIVAFCAGITTELTASIPLVQQFRDDWMMELDIHVGCIKTNIAFMVPDAATPAENYEVNYYPASKTIVKPIPQFIANKLTQLLSLTPHAKLLCDLIPDAIKSGSILTIADSHCGIAPSVSKFLNSAAPYALQIGIDRLAAATILNDFSVIPSAKFYYAKIEPIEIFTAINLLFENLGWGNATSIMRGIATGSAIIVTRTSVTNQYQWMIGEISAAQPGRHCNLQKLVGYHNTFTKFCASLTSFMLGWRNVQQFMLTSQQFQAGITYAAVFDKRTGQFHGPLPVVINRILENQLQLYHSHCVAIHKRLIKTGDTDTKKLCVYLKKLIEGSSGKLFYQINDKYQPISIGSADLTSWWPEPLRFPANFSRSFWQSELHTAGLNSSQIDLFMRHQLQGAESYTSCGYQALKDSLEKIGSAQDKILNDMGILPVFGLARK